LKDIRMKKIVKHVPDDQQPLKPDVNAMLRFIRKMHGQGHAWYLAYGNKAKKQGERTPDSFSNKVCNDLKARLVKANTNGMNVAVAVNTITGNSCADSNVSAVTAVFIDDDDGVLDLDTLLSLSVVPHLIVETSPGRLHAYWLVNNCTVSRFKPVQRALANCLKTDRSVCNPARVMRLPGSINWNHDTPFLTQTVHTSDAPPVAIDVLIKKLKLNLNVDAPEPCKPATKATVSHSGTNTNTRTRVTTLSNKVTAQIRKALTGVNFDDRTLWAHMGMAIHSEAPNEQGYDIWTEFSKTSSKYDEVDQRRTWESFKPDHGLSIRSLYWLAAHAKNGGGSFDDIEAANLFATTFKNKLRFDPQMGVWYCFNDGIWRADVQAHMRSARQLVKDLSAGEGIKDPAIKRYRSATGMKSIVAMAEYETSLHITDLDFDTDKNLLTVKNGVVDLCTGQIRQASATDFLRRCAAVTYDADAKCPNWRNFIRQVTRGDKELAAFLRRAVGYTLFGHTKAQAFFVFDGTGENGKGVFLRIIAMLLGDYATELAPNLITSVYGGNANSSTPALMALKGIRFGSVAELPNTKGFDTAFVKQFSGGDSITARANYGQVVTFKPEGKLWISTNDMPEVAANDKAMWRRIFPIPFKANFSGANRNDDLEEKLLIPELSGILNWALAGARDYNKDGKLNSCPAVQEHKDKLRKESDSLSGWIMDCCIKGEKEQLQASIGFANYVQYAKRCNRKPISQKLFSARLEKSGFPRRETKKFNLYSGLDLRPQVERHS
jgi:putative DNA primase/helicase